MHQTRTASGAIVALLAIFGVGSSALAGEVVGGEASAALVPAPKASVRFEIIGPGHAAYLIESDRVRVVDTRPVAKFLAGHIPGAVHLDDECLRESISGMPARYLEACDLGRVFEKSGVTVDQPVLIYADGDDPLAATMAAYAMMKAGHPRVMVLDGGFEAWRGNHPVTQEFAAFETTAWAGAAVETLAASVADAAQMADTNEGYLVDARPAKLYRGEGKGWVRNGHIPHAVNLDWKSIVRADNEALFKPRSEIESILKDAGLDSRNQTIVYCGTGREATLLYVYLKGVLEWPRVRLFEGSWTEWSAHPELGVETGDGGVAEFKADGDVLIGGQPSAEQLREMADRGVTMVINCRTAPEGSRVGYSESGVAKKLGITYIEIPLGGNEGYDPEDVEALTAALAQRTGDGQTVVHCASGGRAAQLWLAHLVTHRGMAMDVAQDHLRAIGVLQPMAIERLTGQKAATTLRP